MSYETVTFFFALLTVVLVVVAVVLAVLMVTDRSDRTGILAMVRPITVELAAAVGLTCMFGSLYLSEVVGWNPCALCWVQRGFMYPAALVLTAALVVKRRVLVIIGGALAIGGLPVSLYHRYGQATGTDSALCDPTNPCSFIYTDHFGFVTIPTMAAAGFIGILALLAVHLLWRNP
jgi:disulfide bond formation protein DsbB